MDFLPKIVYQDDDLLLARKPHGIASSWGQEACFLDNVKKYGSDFCESTSLRGTKQSIEDVQIRKNQISTFGEDGEYGLLNRLDTVTAGLLYFARSYEAKAEYMHLQEQGSITKTYYAQVYGLPRAQFGRITTPIYHHRDDASRMTTDPEKARGKGQEVVTYWEQTSPSFPLPAPQDISYQINPLQGQRDDQKDESPSLRTERGWGEACWIRVIINSGCRHQIRCHLASIGHPIVGDRLYMSKKMRKEKIGEIGKIELVSSGLRLT